MPTPVEGPLSKYTQSGLSGETPMARRCAALIEGFEMALKVRPPSVDL